MLATGRGGATAAVMVIKMRLGFTTSIAKIMLTLVIKHIHTKTIRCNSLFLLGAIWILLFLRNWNILNRLDYLAWNLIFHNFSKFTYKHISNL